MRKSKHELLVHINCSTDNDSSKVRLRESQRFIKKSTCHQLNRRSTVSHLILSLFIGFCEPLFILIFSHDKNSLVNDCFNHKRSCIFHAVVFFVSSLPNQYQGHSIVGHHKDMNETTIEIVLRGRDGYPSFLP